MTDPQYLPLKSNQSSMVCGSGCCGPPKEPIAPPPSSQTEIEENDSCNDNGSLKAAASDSIVTPTSPCCPPSKRITNNSKDDCCQPKGAASYTDAVSASEPTAKSGCPKGCCSTPNGSVPNVGDASSKIDISKSDGTCESGSHSSKTTPKVSDMSSQVRPTCATGCCSKPASPLRSTPQTDFSNATKTGCCSSQETGLVPQDGNDAGLNSLLLGPKGDCSNNDIPRSASTPVNLAPTECKGKCCSREVPQPVISSNAPPCCAGEKAPCCDDSCIERLALRECTSEESTLRPSLDTEGILTLIPHCSLADS
jgi:hypothetical protein